MDAGSMSPSGGYAAAAAGGVEAAGLIPDSLSPSGFGSSISTSQSTSQSLSQSPFKGGEGGGGTQVNNEPDPWGTSFSGRNHLLPQDDGDVVTNER